MRNRYPVRIDKIRAFLEWLVGCNIIYQAHNKDFVKRHEEVSIDDDPIVDRTDTSSDPVHPDLVKVMQFGISNYNSGDLPSVNNESGGTDNSRIHILFQPDAVSSIEPPVEDIVFWNSNVLPKKKGLGNLAYGMPMLYPFGRGSFDEERPVRMTVWTYGKRCLDLHGQAFGKHWGFLAIIFDAVALSKAYASQYISMRVHSNAIRQGLWDKEDISECIEYIKVREKAASQGIVVSLKKFRIC